MDVLLVPSFRPMWALTAMRKRRISSLSRIATCSSNRVPNFNRALLLFRCSDWQPFAHQNRGASRSCFTAPEMLAYPLAYIISPAALWGGGGRGGQGVLEDKWLSFHWQARLFPPSGWLFHELRFDRRSGPRGVWEAASSDSSLSPVCACWLTERPHKASRKLSSNGLQTHTKRDRNTPKAQSRGRE